MFLMWCIFKCIKGIRTFLKECFGPGNAVCAACCTAILIALVIAGCIAAVCKATYLNGFILVPLLMLAIACIQLVWFYVLCFSEDDEEKK